jgi:hypothetical protein
MILNIVSVTSHYAITLFSAIIVYLRLFIVLSIWCSRFPSLTNNSLDKFRLKCLSLAALK